MTPPASRTGSEIRGCHRTSSHGASSTARHAPARRSSLRQGNRERRVRPKADRGQGVAGTVRQRTARGRRDSRHDTISWRTGGGGIWAGRPARNENTTESDRVFFLRMPHVPDLEAQAIFANLSDITVDLHLGDEFVDLIGGGYDLALRIAALPGSTLRTRRQQDNLWWTPAGQLVVDWVALNGRTWHVLRLPSQRSNPFCKTHTSLWEPQGPTGQSSDRFVDRSSRSVQPQARPTYLGLAIRFPARPDHSGLRCAGRNPHQLVVRQHVATSRGG
jgi:hypothetical protein